MTWEGYDRCNSTNLNGSLQPNICLLHDLVGCVVCSLNGAMIVCVCVRARERVHLSQCVNCNPLDFEFLAIFVFGLL